MNIKIAEIKIGGRFREDYGDIESLAVSIQRYGLLHPVVVDRDKNLITGERRIKACQLIGREEIECKFYDEADDLTKKEIEIEENIRRKNFSWQEEVTAKAELDNIKRQMYGSTVKGHGGGWGQKDTADSLGVAVSSISMDITLSKALQEFPELNKEKSKTSAWKKYQRI